MTTFALAFLLALAESSLGLGAILPGEIALTGLAATVHGTTPTALLVLAVACGAVIGDHVGYLLGRRAGPRLGSSQLVARLGAGRWERATDLVARHGALAVLVSRLLPFVRTVMPAVAGASRLTYRRFLPASLLGGVVWASVWVVAGAAVSASGVLDYAAYTVPGLVVLAAAYVGTRRLARCRRTREAARAARAAVLAALPVVDAEPDPCLL